VAAEECAKRAEAGRQAIQDALEEQRRAEEARMTRGRWARLRDAWRGR
jgi:hypothetical protein